MGEVVSFPGITTLPTDPLRTLENARDKGRDREMMRVLVIIVPEDDPNHPIYFISDPDAGSAIWDMQRLERALHEWADKEIGK